MNEAVKLSLQIAAALVAILPIAAVFFLMKTVQGVAGRFGVKLPGRGVSDAVKKRGKQFAEDQDAKRQIRNLNGSMRGRNNFSLGKYQRRARKDAIRAGIQAEAKRSEAAYVAGQATTGENFRNKLAGGGGRIAQAVGYGATEEALQRALSNAKFTLEKVEADEVKANHATIDTLDEASLMNIIRNTDGKNSEAKVAASMERLVKIGGNENIAEAIDKYGTGGQPTIATKSLAGALQADGPGYLKASDIDNISRGQFGAHDASGNLTTGTAQVAAENLTAGVYSPDKLVAANNDELKYVSGIADAMAAAGDMRAVDRLQKAAKDVNNTPTLAARKKHNGDNIDKLDKYGTVT
jgi:hypothetical protein